MQIVFNTRKPNAPASQFYIESMKMCEEISFFDFDNYYRYDIALFMTYEEDWGDIINAKEINPNIFIGMIDPRTSDVKRIEKNIDFFIVDSLEMKDYFLNYNKPIFIYPDIPRLPFIEKLHDSKEKTVIAYHGNRAHVYGMYPNISSALDLLSNYYNIELWLVYNMVNGKCKIGLPKKITVKHINWYKDVYLKELVNADIGITPSLIPQFKSKSRFDGAKLFGGNKDDYLLRFKMPSNNGRAVVFGYLGIPVVADFLPSYLQLIRDNYSGLIAVSKGGWFYALERLICSADLRNYLSLNMRETIKDRINFNVINIQFIKFLNDVKNKTLSRLNVDFTKYDKFEKSMHKINVFQENLNLSMKRVSKLYKKIL